MLQNTGSNIKCCKEQKLHWIREDRFDKYFIRNSLVFQRVRKRWWNAWLQFAYERCAVFATLSKRVFNGICVLQTRSIIGQLLPAHSSVNIFCVSAPSTDQSSSVLLKLKSLSGLSKTRPSLSTLICRRRRYFWVEQFTFSEALFQSFSFTIL
jgi:hypothetical protein